MTRKDGRELVTEHPLTAGDMIDVVLDHRMPPDDQLTCVLRREVDDSWMQPEGGPGEDGFDIGEWDA